MVPTPAIPAGSESPRRVGGTMHPGMMWWWKHARGRHGCGEGEGANAGEAGDGPRMWAWPGWRGGASGDDFGGGSFGVRRPLRFLAYKLNLSEEQVGQLAKILDELKTERAQAAVDDRPAHAARDPGDRPRRQRGARGPVRLRLRLGARRLGLGHRDRTGGHGPRVRAGAAPRRLGEAVARRDAAADARGERDRRPHD